MATSASVRLKQMDDDTLDGKYRKATDAPRGLPAPAARRAERRL
jgi:hypothetical protein